MLFTSARNFASQVVWDPEGGNQHDPENLQFLAQIPQHLLPLIGTMRPAPSDFLFDASDSMLAGRTLCMNIWGVTTNGKEGTEHSIKAPRCLHCTFRSKSVICQSFDITVLTVGKKSGSFVKQSLKSMELTRMATTTSTCIRYIV